MLVLIGSRSPPPISSRKTSLDDLEQMVILQRSLHTLLVVELLVDRVLALVRALLDADVDPVARRQGAQEADAEGEACGVSVCREGMDKGDGDGDGEPRGR
jgi:hypothetical protein